MARDPDAVTEAWEYVRAVTGERYPNCTESPSELTVKAKRTANIWNEDLYFVVKSDGEQFLFYIVPDLPVPQEDLPGVMEYVTRANAGLRIGNFELKLQERLLRFKSSIAFTDARLTEALIKAAIIAAEVAVDTYVPGLINVITGEQSPLEAIEAIEY